ncbi:unnamed protein product [Clavelina lepadiformis]|uniref:C2H2-type domain-containing protein n=1 Tax=Clavelina lepadiformis TaxID=159417 RepID=A0ABP0GGR2_CLALP
MSSFSAVDENTELTMMEMVGTVVKCEPECLETINDAGQDSVNPASARMYKKKDSNEKRKWQCRFCVKGFAKSYVLKNHMITHSAERPYQCDICQRTYSQKSSMKRHKAIKHDLLSETKTTEKSKPVFKKWNCSICEKRFLSHQALTTHRRTHTGKKPFRCKICDRPFAQEGDLKSHIRRHTGEKPYHCTICDKRFTTSGERGVHMRYHQKKKSYQCNICCKTFYRANKMKEHILKVHMMTISTSSSVVKPLIHSCSVCEKGFAACHKLREHMITHSEI